MRIEQLLLLDLLLVFNFGQICLVKTHMNSNSKPSRQSLDPLEHLE